MIGYLSGQDDAILPAREYPLCPAKKYIERQNKFFVGQACSVKMAGYKLALFSFYEFMDLESVSVQKRKKTHLAAILGNNDISMWYGKITRVFSLKMWSMMKT